MTGRIIIVLVAAVGLSGGMNAVGARDASAQSVVSPLSSSRQPITFSTGVYYEDFASDEIEVSELSTSMHLNIPLGRGVVTTIRAGHAIVSTVGFDQLSGFDDLQVTVSGGKRIQEGSLLFTVSGNVPSGKRRLGIDEFDASIPLSYNFFDFRIPSLGQAPGISAGGALAYAPLDRLAVGVGVSYTIHMGFKPIEDMQNSYVPGNEFVLTGGVEVGVSERTSVSTDFTYTLYGNDAIRDVTIFEAGPKLFAAVQLTSYFGFNVLTVAARHRTHASSRILVSDSLEADGSLTLPAQTDGVVRYGWHFSRSVNVGMFVSGRIFKSSPAFGEKVALDFGAAPSFRLTQSFLIATQFVYTTGDIDGFETGLMLTVQL